MLHHATSMNHSLISYKTVARSNSVCQQCATQDARLHHSLSDPQILLPSQHLTMLRMETIMQQAHTTWIYQKQVLQQGML